MAERRSRIDQIKRYLDEHAAEIEAIDFGRVSFDLYGGDLKARVERTDKLGSGASVDRLVATD